MIACVYIIKSLKNNWVYIGQTNNIVQRMRNHRCVAKKNKSNNDFYKDVRLYKWDNFEIQILYHMYEVYDKKLLNKIEKEYIAEYRKTHNCYNLDSGGDSGYTQSNISLKRRSASRQRGGCISFQRVKKIIKGIKYEWYVDFKKDWKYFAINKYGLVKALVKCIIMKIRHCKKHNIPFKL